MNSMTEYLKHKILKETLIDKQVYVGLFTTGGEVDKASYERMPISFTTPANGQIVNSASVFFPDAQEIWGDIARIGLFDAQVGGNLLFIDTAQEVKTVGIANQYHIPQNYMIVGLM